jgi:hypothetical protein
VSFVSLGDDQTAALEARPESVHPDLSATDHMRMWRRKMLMIV